MKYLKILPLILVLGFINPVYSRDVKKNRDKICNYVSNVGNWVQGVINTFEGIVRFGSTKGFSKEEMLGMKDQWIKTYKQRDMIAKENIEVCNIRGNPFQKWQGKDLRAINRNVGRVNNMASDLEKFLNKNQGLKRLPACRDFLRAWNKIKKPDNYFR